MTTYNLLSEFFVESIMFQWLFHSAADFKWFDPMINTRYCIEMPKQEMIDDNIFGSGTNNKTLQADAIDKIKTWYKAHIVLICTADVADFRGKINIVPYQYLTKSGQGVNSTNFTDFACA